MGGVGEDGCSPPSPYGVGPAVAFWWTAPWKLGVDETVNEAFPTATAQTDAPAALREPTVLASGGFVSHEHATTGRVLLVELADGQRVLRIEDLDTSNGPLFAVFLTDAPVRPGSDGWRVFDDGRYVDLGEVQVGIVVLDASWERPPRGS